MCLQSIGDLLANASPADKPAAQQRLFDKVLDSLVGDDSRYMAAALRMKDHNGDFVLRSRQGNVDWFHWQKLPLTKGTLADEVVRTGRLSIVTDVIEDAHKFANSSWISSVGIKSALCVPLKSKGQLVGTLTVYTAYIHHFSHSDAELLTVVASLVAFFAIRSEAERQRDKVLSRLHDSQLEIYTAAKQAAQFDSLHTLIHDQKNLLLKTRRLLGEIKTSGTLGQATEVAAEAERWVGENERKLRRTTEA